MLKLKNFQYVNNEPEQKRVQTTDESFVVNTVTATGTECVWYLDIGHGYDLITGHFQLLWSQIQSIMFLYQMTYLRNTVHLLNLM